MTVDAGLSATAPSSEPVSGLDCDHPPPELVLEVMSWQPQLVEAFTHASGNEARVADLGLSVAAVLCAHAMNVGFTPVTTPSVDALTRDRLHHVDANYVRFETITTANTPLVEAQAQIPTAQAWGGGLVASVDGLRFVVPVNTIYARSSPRFFGLRKRGITWLNMINDQAAGLAAKVLSGTPRDSLHAVDVVLRQRGGVVPEAIITDTGSYSDIVFGLLHLLGRSYQPQLANLPDQKMWRIDPGADYGPLNQAARGRIDLGRIAGHWTDMCRIAVSIHSGEVSAHEVTRMISREARLNHWDGEMQGLQTTLERAVERLVRLDRADRRRPAGAVDLGVPVVTGNPER